MKALICLCAIALTGCGAAGVANYNVRPIVSGESVICCEVSVVNGKEYATLEAHIQKQGNDYTVDLKETAVSAFAGQKIAADAAGSAVSSVVKGAATTLIAPTAAGALGTGLQLLAK